MVKRWHQNRRQSFEKAAAGGRIVSGEALRWSGRLLVSSRSELVCAARGCFHVELLPSPASATSSVYLHASFLFTFSPPSLNETFSVSLFGQLISKYAALDLSNLETVPEVSAVYATTGRS